MTWFKRCRNCRQDLPHAAFNRASRSPDGLQTYCADCNAAKGREYRARNRASAPGALTFGAKRCSGHCGLLLPVSHFSVNRTERDGLQARCRRCNREDHQRSLATVEWEQEGDSETRPDAVSRHPDAEWSR